MIIINLEKFKGNRVEKNIARISAIKELKNNKEKLNDVLNNLIDAVKSNDRDICKHLLEQELFFEIIPDDVFDKYWNIFRSMEDDDIYSIYELYNLRAEKGFIFTYMMLNRQKNRTYVPIKL